MPLQTGQVFFIAVDWALSHNLPLCILPDHTDASENISVPWKWTQGQDVSRRRFLGNTLNLDLDHQSEWHGVDWFQSTLSMETLNWNSGFLNFQRMQMASEFFILQFYLCLFTFPSHILSLRMVTLYMQGDGIGSPFQRQLYFLFWEFSENHRGAKSVSLTSQRWIVCAQPRQERI